MRPRLLGDHRTGVSAQVNGIASASSGAARFLAAAGRGASSRVLAFCHAGQDSPSCHHTPRARRDERSTRRARRTLRHLTERCCVDLARRRAAASRAGRGCPMSGWIYAVEIAPAGWIKVGRSTKVASRLGQHVAAAAFGGGAVVRMASFSAVHPETAERGLLRVLAEHPRAVLAHGKETFTGITFMEVAAIADGICQPVSTQPRTDVGSLARRCAEVMDEVGVTRASLDHLRRLLLDPGLPTNQDLGRELRRAGVQTASIHCPTEGRSMQGVKRELLGVPALAA